MFAKVFARFSARRNSRSSGLTGLSPAVPVRPAWPQEKRKAFDVKLNLPPEAPRFRDWHVERKNVIAEACYRLGVGSSVATSEESRMVGLAGPSGAGKSVAASMVIAREDVRTSFQEGVLWLQAGKRAKDHLPELMFRLACMVYETVMQKECRPPRSAGPKSDPENGVSYILEVMDLSSRRFLVVVDDVWDVEVLEELERAGMWVLYTSRQHDLLPEAPLRLDQVLKEEAEMVLRRAADLDDDAHLPKAVDRLMEGCEFAARDLAFVGRWGVVRHRNDDRNWQVALERIAEAQKGSEGGHLLSWRAAVLRAGLEELARANPQAKELYLSLGVIPQGLSFPPEVATVLLHGSDWSAEASKAVRKVTATLERWSILTLQGDGRFRVDREHANFVQDRLSAYPCIRGKALLRWQKYISSVRALLAFSSASLVEIWAMLALGEEDEAIYDATLGALDPSDAERPTALRNAAAFHWSREEWLKACIELSQLLDIQEACVDGNAVDLATTLHNLGVCSGEAGKTQEAINLLHRALAIRSKSLGNDHPDLVTTLNKLGVCVYRAGRWTDAEESFRQALEIREKRLGGDHRDVATTLDDLGVCVYMAGRAGDAKKLFRRALAMKDKTVGASLSAVDREPDAAVTDTPSGQAS